MQGSGKRFLITGGAGFIGSNMADRLLSLGAEVIVYDNFSTGFREFIQEAAKNPRFRLIEGDVLDLPKLTEAMQKVDCVFHFAANADVRFGVEHPRKDLEQNTIATFNVLEAMRLNQVPEIGFSSTGSIYGEPEVFPTPEDAPFPIQTSLYGASKLAGEGLLAAYANGFGTKATVFRFTSILGERYTHGHVFDFYKKLLSDPSSLYILGNGEQRKSYLYIQDCLDAMLLALSKRQKTFEVYNLGLDAYSQVNDSVRWISEHLGLKPRLSYAGGERGWIGDSPFIYLDTKKIHALGWQPKLNIQQALIKTLDWLMANRWVMEKRQ